jgi:hypothetical protein
MGQLQQLNITFDPIEDRLMMRISSLEGEDLHEYRAWLTRRIVRLLWQAFDKLLEQEPAFTLEVPASERKKVLQFQEQAVLSQADFSKPYSSDQAKPAFEGIPVLVSKLHIRKTSPSGYQLSLVNDGDQGIHLGINSWLIHSVRKLLSDVALGADWDLDLQVTSSGPSPDTQDNRTIN